MHRRAAAHGHVFDGPAPRGEQARDARKQLALRHGDEVREAIGARHGDEFGVGIHRQPRLDLGREVARLAIIDRRAHAADFHEAQVRVHADEAGEKMQAREVERAIRALVEARGDRRDAAVAHEHIAGSQGAFCHGMHGGAAQEERFSLRRERQRKKGQQDEDQFFHGIS